MNRIAVRWLAACLMAAGFQMAAAAPAASDAVSDELLGVAAEVLRKTDTDRVSELWDSGSNVLKARMNKTAFMQATRKARQSMGPVASRDWSSVTRLKYRKDNEDGFPAGLYANVVFSTELDSGRKASERISFAMENNHWIFTGYAIAREAPDMYTMPAKPAIRPSQPPVPTVPSAPSMPSAPSAAVAEVEAAVRGWASAWSAQDMDRYLAAYAPEFTPARGQSRGKWEEERRVRITGKSSIGVTLEDLVISINDRTATARFRQNYRADKLKEVSRKVLELQRSGNQWLIRKESTGG